MAVVGGTTCGARVGMSTGAPEGGGFYQGSLHDVGSRVSKIEGRLDEWKDSLATKADVERAKNWVLAAILASVLSVLSAVATVIAALIRILQT